jgi:hypothetical protein
MYFKLNWLNLHFGKKTVLFMISVISLYVHGFPKIYRKFIICPQVISKSPRNNIAFFTTICCLI